LPKLQVTFSKLKKYIEQQGGYDLEQKDDTVTLSFVPAFPEALEKGWEGSPPPRVIMHGQLLKGLLTFNSVEVEEDHKLRAKDEETAEFTYRGWLQFIEENY
jgi:hypothetical protein